MFEKDTGLVYRVTELDEYPWLDCGFGTRHARDWPPEPVAWVRQIHSDRCVVAEGPGCLGQADALLTGTPGCYLTIRTADCVPILLADTRRRAVAAVHAGWRGSVQAIVFKAVKKLEERFGSRPEDLVAAIGPGVCGRCYEVGAEVADQFRRWLPEPAEPDGRRRIDLADVNRRQLLEAGLEAGRIFAGAPCTASNPGEFFSWRRERVRAGRMVSGIAIRP